MKIGEELNPSEEELEKSLNPDEEDSDEELEFLEEDEESDEETLEEESEDKPKDALQIFNEELRKRGLNKNYKSWDDVAKSEKQRDIEFAQKKKPMEVEKVEQPVVEKQAEVQEVKQPTDISERLLRLEHPESVHVIDQMKASHPGQDIYAVWEQSEFYKKEAAVRAEEARSKERMSNPSGSVGEAKVVDEVSAKFMKEDRLPRGFKFNK